VCPCPFSVLHVMILVGRFPFPVASLQIVQIDSVMLGVYVGFLRAPSLDIGPIWHECGGDCRW
jgi:hypothetical protein